MKLVFGVILGMAICILFYKCNPDNFIVYQDKIVEKVVEKPSEPEKIIEYKDRIVYKNRYIKVPIKSAESTIICSNETKNEDAIQSPTQPVSEVNKNNVSVLLGRGATDLSNRTNPSGQVEVEVTYGFTFGLLYQRKFEYFNAGVGGFSNKTIFGTIGKDF